MNTKITLTDKQTRQVQLVLLEILIEFRRICNLAGINYCIIAGTLLGAARHKGFIPWDDDADVALLRSDYEKFCSVVDKYIDKDKFYFQDHKHTKGYRWGYGKLRRKDSLYIVAGTETQPYEQGIWLDIFPLDSIPDTRFGRTICNFYCFVIRKFLYSETGKTREKNRFKRILYSVMSKVPFNAIIKYYDKYIIKRNRNKTNWVRILMFPTPNNQFGYLRKWYEQTEDIKFENDIFKGIRDYDEYLTFKFGNYHVLPPEEGRKQHKVSRLKFPGKEEELSEEGNNIRNI